MHDLKLATVLSFGFLFGSIFRIPTSKSRFNQCETHCKSIMDAEEEDFDHMRRGTPAKRGFLLRGRGN